MIYISNMRPGLGGAKATFDAEIEGWLLRDCVIVQRPEGNLSALPPALRDGRRSISVTRRLWFEFVNAARWAYRRIRQEKGREVDDGLRKVLCAGAQEVLEKAEI